MHVREVLSLVGKCVLSLYRFSHTHITQGFAKCCNAQLRKDSGGSQRAAAIIAANSLLGKGSPRVRCRTYILSRSITPVSDDVQQLVMTGVCDTLLARMWLVAHRKLFVNVTKVRSTPRSAMEAGKRAQGKAEASTNRVATGKQKNKQGKRSEAQFHLAG